MLVAALASMWFRGRESGVERVRVYRAALQSNLSQHHSSACCLQNTRHSKQDSVRSAGKALIEWIAAVECLFALNMGMFIVAGVAA